MQIDEVFPAVRDAIVRCCDLDPTTVRLESRLVTDLGMESLDFVELVFEIEQQFEISVPMAGLEGYIEEAMGNEPYEVDGILTAVALDRLSQMVGGLADFDANAEIPTDQVPMLLTVHSVCDLIIREKEKEKASPEPA